jgi:hypothetical protein
LNGEIDTITRFQTSIFFAQKRLMMYVIAKSMTNGLAREAPENAKQAFLGDFAATGETDLELFRYTCMPVKLSGKEAVIFSCSL